MENKAGYLVMARKWRPTTFADVVGQQHIVRSLKNAIAMNRVAGAYLFSGMRGVGKTSMARIFARSINCEKGPTPTPCGECRNCLEISDGSALDVVEIDGASNNGVDEVRELRDHVMYAPVRCRMKIYIIDEVHMLSTAAFNAFLKTLEEPPPNTVFIMATTEQSKVPETVLSRCQCFEFRAISDSLIAERLKAIADKEKMDITPGALMMVARRAEGSMRDAQSLLDQAAAYGGGKLDEDALGLVLGLVSRDKIWGIMRAVIERQTDSALEQLRNLYYSGFDVGVIIRELCDASRALTVAKVSGAPEKLLDEPLDMVKTIIEMVKNVSTGRLQQFFDILLRARSLAASAGNPLSVLEMTVIKMIRLDEVIPVAEILGMLREGGVALTVQTPKVDANVSREQVSSPAGFNGAPMIERSPAAPDSKWDAIKAGVAAKRPMLAGLLDKVKAFSVADGRAVFSYSEKIVNDQCEENRELLEAVIEKTFGKKMPLMLSPFKEAVKQDVDLAEKKSDYERKARKEMSTHPMIQKAVDIFDGRPGFEDDSGSGT